MDAANEDLAYITGVQAYVYGYATVELYRTFYEQTQDPDRGHSVGIGEFNHIRRLTTPGWSPPTTTRSTHARGSI